jgi:hypothetical protein
MFSLIVLTPIRLCRQRHVLRLHIGREAWILFCGNIGGAQWPVGADADRVWAEDVLRAPRPLPVWQSPRQVIRVAVGHNQIAACDGARHQKCSRLNAVGLMR